MSGRVGAGSLLRDVMAEMSTSTEFISVVCKIASHFRMLQTGLKPLIKVSIF